MPKQNTKTDALDRGRFSARRKTDAGPVLTPGKVFDWSLAYDPAANGGHGEIKAALGDAYNPLAFGQKAPDRDWMQHNDRRGICIPPYFVFQFRADGHPQPKP